MTREEAIRHIRDVINIENNSIKPIVIFEQEKEALYMAIEALSAEAVQQSEQYKKGFEDAKRAFFLEYARESETIRERNAQLEVINNVLRGFLDEVESTENHTQEHVIDCTELIRWLLEEIMDEENWELNAVAYGEVIARKLKKLGLLKVKDGYYVRTPLVEAEPTVIRSKTLMPTKDFKEWAKRVREENPNVNVIVIPCDAEVVSAESIMRNATAEERASVHRLYIKVYADDDPWDKAEKMYRICGDIAELAEVAKGVQEYLDEPSA